MAATLNETDDKKQTKVANSLSDLQTKTVTIDIELVGDEVFTVEMRPLTYGEWERIGKEIPQPEPQGIPGRTGIVYQTDDPNYKRAISEVEDRRAIRRTAAALVTAFPDGCATLDQKVEYIENSLDSGVVTALVGAMWEIHRFRKAQVSQRAATFHNRRNSPVTNGTNVTPESEPVP